MKVPCHTCIVKVNCMHRIKKMTYNDYETYYIFDELLQECEQLREYFGLDTPTMKVKMKGLNKFFYNQSLGSLIEDENLIKQFLKVMHKKQMPKSDYRVMRIKKKKAVVKNV
jgi:hypothetical protein